MSYDRLNKMKKADLIDLLSLQDNEIKELREKLDWMGNVEKHADERIEVVRQDGIELLEDVLYDIRWIQSTEDPKKALEDTIKVLRDYVIKYHREEE